MDNSAPYPQNTVSASFSEHTFDLAYWKSIPQKLSHINSNSQPKDILLEYERLHHTLLQLNTCSDPKNYFVDPSIQSFFIDKLLIGVSKSIMRSKVKFNNDLRNMLNNCLREMILLWLKLFSEEYLGLFETVVTILDLSQPYYNQTDSSLPPSATNIKNDNLKSSFFDELIDVIGLKEGRIFDRIYELVTNVKNLPSVRMMVLLCSLTGNLSHRLPQEYAREYINKLREAICDNNLSKHAISYKDCFTEKNAKTLIKSFKLMLKEPLFSVEERYRAIDALQLQITRICLDSSDDKIQDLGYRILRDVVTDLMNPTASQIKGQSMQYCNEFLKDLVGKGFEQSFFEKIGSTESYLKIFLYMFTQNLLKSNHIKIFWTSFKMTKFDRFELTIKKIFKRNHICSLLDCLLLEVFTDNTWQDKTLEDFMLITRLYYESSNKFLIEERIIETLWKAMLNNDTINDQKIFQFNFHHYSEISYVARGSSFALATLDRCIAGLEEDITRFELFRIIYTLIPDMRGERRYIRQPKIFSLFIQYMKSFLLQTLPKVNPATEEFYMLQISERVQCLKVLLDDQVPEIVEFSYKMLDDLFATFTEHSFLPDEKEYFLKVLYKVVDAYKGSLMRPEDIKSLFQHRILNKEIMQYLRKTKSGAECLVNILMILNCNIKNIWKMRPLRNLVVEEGFVVKVAPEQLEGYEEIWSFIMSCEDKEGTSTVINFLAKVYWSLEDKFEPELASIRERSIARCFECIGSSSKITLKCIELIHRMMDETGRTGIYELDSHAKLIKSDPLEISMQAAGVDWKAKTTVQSSITVLELLEKVAELYGTTWEEIKLHRDSNSLQEISSIHYGRTLAEIGMNKHESLTISEKKFAPTVDLLRDYNALSERATALFTKIFDRYSVNEKMSTDDYAAYVNAWVGNCPNSSHFKVREGFRSYDLDRDGVLSLDEFLNSRLEGCINSPDEVWNSLLWHKKRHDLREKEDIAHQQADKKSLVSYIIRYNSKYLDTLIALLDCEEEEIACEAWKLLNRLPTHPQVFEDVVVLKGIRGIEDPQQRDWNALLNLKAKYKLLYVLNIVEYLMFYNEKESKISLLEEEKLIEYQKTWQKDFITYGGLDHLRGIFNLLKPSGPDDGMKRIISFAKTIRDGLKKPDSGILECGEFAQKQLSIFIELVGQYENSIVHT